MASLVSTLRERLVHTLADSGKTQTWLASQLGISPQTLNQWLIRGRVPVSHIFAVAGLLGCTPEWLAGEKEDKNKLCLSEKEKNLLYAYRSFTPDVKHAMLLICDAVDKTD